MRKLRALQKGAKYHVVSKINTGRFALESDEFKSLFLDTVKRAKKKYKFSIHNFVIMENHAHFIIEPLTIMGKEESLSRIMQWILSVFAMYYNKINKTDGHVWKGRFWSKIISDIKQLFDTFRYISENPVKSNIIKDAGKYKYGGLFFIKNNIFDIIQKPLYDYE